MTPLNILPVDIQADWMTTLNRYIDPDAKGHFYLVGMRRTRAKSFEELRVIVRVVDENEQPLANIPVAFAYSTADQYTLTPDFLWSPPSPPKAFVIPTDAAGQIDQYQGSTVNKGEPGGITVYLLVGEWSSDVVAGCGALSNHEGLELTFQLQRNGVVSLEEWKAGIEARVSALEAWIPGQIETTLEAGDDTR